MNKLNDKDFNIFRALDNAAKRSLRNGTKWTSPIITKEQ